VNFAASQPNTIAPEIRITMEITVLNIPKDSTVETTVTRRRRYSSVAGNVTWVDLQSATGNLKSAVHEGS